VRERVLALMPRRPCVGDDGAVTGRNRALAVAGVVLYGVAVALLGVRAAGPASTFGDQLGPALLALPPSILLGVVVTWRRPQSPVGPGLVWLAAAPALTWAVEEWGGVVAPGVWPFNFAGFVRSAWCSRTACCPAAAGAPSRGRSWRRRWSSTS
jgi:hypothetical protein